MGCLKSKLNNTTFDNTNTFTLSKKKCNVKVLRVYDGDTLWVALKLHNQFYKFKVRMLGYDSPELHPRLNKQNRIVEITKALAAKTYIENLVLNKIVSAEFYDFDKYGRPLCNLYIDDPDKCRIPCPNKVCVNTLMIRNNHGYPYMGGTKKN